MKKAYTIYRISCGYHKFTIRSAQLLLSQMPHFAAEQKLQTLYGNFAVLRVNIQNLPGLIQNWGVSIFVS